MNRKIIVLFFILFTSSVGAIASERSLPIAPAELPAFTHTGSAEWLNTVPIRTENLKGQVVLLDFWTFACWNCFRSFPWLNSVEQKFSKDGLTVIGVHTPEFEYEKVRANVVKKAAEFDLTHPIMLDNDFSYWKAMDNRYWPAYYLIDRSGKIRHLFVGETHKGDKQAKKIEKAIAALLAEKPE